MQTRQLDDALESLGGQRMHSSVAATVRGTARQQATGADRTKDKADRATYQTVLDPRTRLVRCLPPLLACTPQNKLSQCMHYPCTSAH